MAKVTIDSKFFEGMIKHLREEQHVGFELDEYDADDVQTMEEVTEGLFQFIGDKLNEGKNETEPYEIEIPAAGVFRVSHREGTEGNWGVGFTAGAAFKKRIKGDAEAEEILDDDNDDEE